MVIYYKNDSAVNSETTVNTAYDSLPFDNVVIVADWLVQRTDNVNIINLFHTRIIFLTFENFISSIKVAGSDSK